VFNPHVDRFFTLNALPFSALFCFINFTVYTAQHEYRRRASVAHILIRKSQNQIIIFLHISTIHTQMQLQLLGSDEFLLFITLAYAHVLFVINLIRVLGRFNSIPALLRSMIAVTNGKYIKILKTRVPRLISILTYPGALAQMWGLGGLSPSNIQIVSHIF